jgi:hypothetical protein
MSQQMTLMRRASHLMVKMTKGVTQMQDHNASGSAVQQAV